jgi:hypothetical protein
MGLMNMYTAAWHKSIVYDGTLSSYFNLHLCQYCVPALQDRM